MGKILVLVGGIQASGKTTLLTNTQNFLGKQITIINPGELFRRYFYHERLMTVGAIEDKIVDLIEQTPPHSIVALHWHYAVRRPEGYIPQISFSRLEQLLQNPTIEHVVLLLLEAPVKVIYERRLKDSAIKKRELSQIIIAEELAKEEKFMILHQEICSNVLGSEHVHVVRVRG